ncbi:hypothetical protein ACFLXE_01240 [Chloroflexota bacterium]
MRSIRHTVRDNPRRMLRTAVPVMIILALILPGCSGGDQTLPAADLQALLDRSVSDDSVPGRSHGS